jgi:hypothetical protein
MSTTAEQQSVRQEERLTRISSLAAFEIGGDVTEQRIKNIITASNTEGILFHGVKRNSRIESISKDGIEPLTPESLAGNAHGMSSYWTMGESLFGGIKTNGKLETYDTTFFHWSHASDGQAHVNIALATKADLEKIAPVNISPNSANEVYFTVPPSHFTLLRTRVDPKDFAKGGRYAYQRAEQRMIDLLELVIGVGSAVRKINQPELEKVTV